MKYQSSIRQKITLGYYGTVALVAGISLFTFLELRFLEKKVIFGETISGFFDTALEIRRFEKNYILYRQETDFMENQRYVAKAREILDNNRSGFEVATSHEEIVYLIRDLRQYEHLMEKYASWRRSEASGEILFEEPLKKVALEGEIRKTGKAVTTRAEDISRTVTKNLQIILYKTQRNLVFSLISLALLAIAVGQVLTRMVVRPLKSLEEKMKEITEGRFQTVAIDSKDMEIVSLTNAFNKMLRELEIRQRHLVQSEKLASLGTLLSGVAHELNNPLSNVSLSCQILMEEIEERNVEQKRELLAMIDEQTERAKNIVRSLLEFSRDKEFKKEAVSLKRLVEETLRFLKGQVSGKIAIHVDIPGEIEILVDKQRIQQVFLNLIKNAAESIPGEGDISIVAKKHIASEKTVETKALYSYMKYRGKCTIEGDTVDIEMRDTGAGIPPEILPKVFDPFFTTKDVGKGSGLGLSIVHEIIEEHDGCIAVESEVGKGTAFFISLPIKEKETTDAG